MMSLCLRLCLSILLLSVRGEANEIRESGQLMTLIMFDKEDEPTAVCNDGSTGGYYFSSASDSSQEDVFVIYLPGGGQCWDAESCAIRSGTYISSDSFPLTRSVFGILDSDPDHTPLWGANKAYLGYCSSDGYMGDVTASDDTFGWHFRGISLVKALVRALNKNHNLNSAKMIYFVGSSAGGRGVMVHLDSLVGSGLLPSAANVIGFLDSPYYLDIDPYSSDFQGFAYQEQQKFLLYNTTAIIDDDCATAYPNDLWKCQFGQYRMPFVDNPYFMIASQYDSYQLDNNIQESAENYDDNMMHYAAEFGALDRDDLRSLTTAIESKFGGGYGLYSWACYNHAVASSSLFYESATSDGISQKEAFEEFLSRQPVSVSPSASSFVLSWIDSCTEFACDVNC